MPNILGNIKGAKGDTGLIPNFSVSALKSTPNKGNLVFVTDAGKEGIFKLDSSDTTTAENGGTVLVDSEGKRWKRQIDNFVNVKWFGAIGNNSNDTNAVKLAINSGAKTVFFPAGEYTISETINLNGCNIVGERFKTLINFLNCNGFVINQNSISSIKDLYITEYSANGIIDQKLHDCILADGSTGNPCPGSEISNVFIRGFNQGINLKYALNTKIDNVQTIFCNIGINLFGQSVNNSIANCTLSAIDVCVQTLKDGTTQGEGLVINNSLLAEANYAVKSNGFLSLHVNNSILDFLKINALNLTNTKVLRLCNNWIYSKLDSIKFDNLGVLDAQDGLISANRIESTEGMGINIGGNNSHIIVSSNHIKTSNIGAAYILKCELGSQNIVFSYNICSSTYAGMNIFLGGEFCSIHNNSGNTLVQYYDKSKRNSITNNFSEFIDCVSDNAPTAGTWKRGDKILNNQPTAGGYTGWICVVAGTPGTWKGFGVIQA